MTIIYQAETLPPQSPQTHAFIVGVGHYPYPQNVGSRLTGLTSSVVSARTFADWLIQTPLHNPTAPLGTVELLLSAIKPEDQHYALDDGSTVAINTAIWPNIRKAFDDWFDRCNQHPDNVAIFYFCGHGLEKGATLSLLPANFGQSRANQWADTINFTATFEGMIQSCKAQTQCYFIDACRELDLATLKTSDFGGQSLCKGDATSKNSPATLRIYATTAGAQAFGEEHQVSRLTSVLLQALQQSKHNDGRVDLVGLAMSVHSLMTATNQNVPPGKQQTVDPQVGGDSERIIHYTIDNADRPFIPPPLPDPPYPPREDKLPPEQEESLRELLAQHERNLRHLLRQKGTYGAGEEPLRLLNQIEAEKKEIAEIKRQLGQ